MLGSLGGTDNVMSDQGAWQELGKHSSYIKERKNAPPKKTKIKLNQMTVSSFPVLVIQVTASLQVSVLPNCN